jgi:hypothetical protein
MSSLLRPLLRAFGAVIGLSLLAPAAQAADNLVEDGDFVRGVQAWSLFQNPPTTSVTTRAVSAGGSATGKALRIEVAVRGRPEMYRATLEQRLAGSVAQGQIIELAFRARSVGGDFQIGAGLRDRKNATAVFFSPALGAEWRDYRWRVPARIDIAEGDMTFVFHLASGSGAFEIHGVSVRLAPLTDYPPEGASFLFDGRFEQQGFANWEILEVGENRAEPSFIAFGQDSRQTALRLAVRPMEGARPWDLQLRQVIPYPVFAGDRHRLGFWARAESRVSMTVVVGGGGSNFFTERFMPGPEWRRFEFAVPVPRDLERGRARLEFHLAQQPGTVEFADVQLLRGR